MNKELKDKIFCDVLEYSLELECERAGKELPGEEELHQDLLVSKEFEKKMLALFKAQKRKALSKYILSISKKIAVCFMFVLLLNTTLLITVEAYRVSFFNLCVTVKDGFTTFVFTENTGSSKPDMSGIPEEWDTVYVPAAVPKGFSIENSISTGNIKRIIYVDKDNKLTINFSYYPIKSSTFSIDTEDAQMDRISIDSNTGYVSVKDSEGEERTSVVWNDETTAFSIISTLDKNTVISIAKSVEKIK